jgi:hypothetical protein
MGKDKVESASSPHAHPDIPVNSPYSARIIVDEDLIKYAWPQDVWFHVDKLSSAHVYLRMPEGMSWETIPQALLVDCAQLVKANSIEGGQSTLVGLQWARWLKAIEPRQQEGEYNDYIHSG